MLDTSLVIGLVLVFVVGFFAWQWWSASGRRRGGSAGGRQAMVPAPVGTATMAVEGPAVPVAPAPERMPAVPGQTEADLRAKEPPQARRTDSGVGPVTAEGQGPAAPVSAPDNLRHPEALFHQPAATAPGAAIAKDVAAGRAGPVSTTGVAGGSQGFGPEMAQNGGAVVGGVFAFDGMEPTGFASF